MNKNTKGGLNMLFNSLQQKPQPQAHAQNHRKTRPQPHTMHIDLWNQPQYRPPVQPKRKPQVIVPVITHQRKQVQFNPGESCYYEGKVTVDTNLLFDSCEGYLYITSQRLIMDASRNGFNVYISDLSKCRKIVGGLELTIISRTYRIYTYEANTIKKIIDELMYQYSNDYDEVDDYALHNSYVAPSSTTSLESVVEESTEDPYEEIKKLKELLDMGIITQAEFDLKKHQLLGI